MPLLPDSWNEMPAAITNRLGHTAGRQRLIRAEGHMLLVFHKVPNAEDDLRQGQFFWRKPSGAWLASSGATGVEALAEHVNSYATVIDEAATLEQNATGVEEHFEAFEAITPVYRATQNLLRVMQEAREATKDEDEDEDEELFFIDLRDRVYQLERTAELLFAGIQPALELKQAQASHQMAVSAHRLNILAAFFFPLSLLTTVSGANYKEVLQGKFPATIFVAVLFLGVVLGLGLKKWTSQRKTR